MSKRVFWAMFALHATGCANIEGVYFSSGRDSADSTVNESETDDSDRDGEGQGPAEPQDPEAADDSSRPEGELGCRDVQLGRVVEGERVQLTGVTVSTPMGIRAPGFFVQDPGGGTWSGLWVYLDDADVTVELGDVINVSGTVAEWHGLTELIVTQPIEVLDTDTSRTVDAVTLTTIPADWEPYEGVVVRLQGVAFSGAEDERGNAMTNWYIGIDQTFMDVSSVEGAYRHVTGLLTYSWGTYKLAPRTAADFQR